ncbi:putative enzyme of poly-gamma-glutamate biosynthesis [Anaerolinea thermolimosa]|uniref:CapA family protein n=1 Tax=Anaerolinea thermolimosa TaxID=229919 RepID=UPI000785E563|nr:CapA family protein [Anaerolinea thermolimosa]GAP05889.1 putative enzyme of poly-gamma-glutamate biosynthesis [Anaerolinea thermolimosa]
MRLQHCPGILWILINLFWFQACTPLPAAAAPDLDRASPAAPIQTTQAPTLPAPTSSAISIWLSPSLPGQAREQILHAWPGMVTSSSAKAHIQVVIGGSDLSSADQTQIGEWVYALVVPFFQPILHVTLDDLQQAWKGKAPAAPLWMTSETLEVFKARWGQPVAGMVRVESPDNLLQKAWNENATWALVPFEQLDPRWRVLRVNGQSPFDPQFSPSTYPLSIPIVATGNPSTSPNLTVENYNRDHLTVLAMSGVTALARRTAELMNEKGILYPAISIDQWLRSADLTHISNEVSFNQDCPPSKAALREALFCSPPDYIRLLDAVGTDIIELTGNHNLDRGEKAYFYSLELYRQRGWGTYGGGANLEEAQRPLFVEHHGNRLVFLGCNMAGPEIAWAGQEKPGAAPCDFDALTARVASLSQAGYLPVVTLQAFETEDYRPAPMQQPNSFVRLAQAGAVVVSGSQAHVPQGFQFVGDHYIHFGLGNLFFDQTDTSLTRQATIDRHIFYEGRYLGVELLPIRIVEYGRPVPMSEDEAQSFVERLFHASFR